MKTRSFCLVQGFELYWQRLRKDAALHWRFFPGSRPMAQYFVGREKPYQRVLFMPALIGFHSIQCSWSIGFAWFRWSDMRKWCNTSGKKLCRLFRFSQWRYWKTLFRVHRTDWQLLFPSLQRWFAPHPATIPRSLPVFRWHLFAISVHIERWLL